MWLRAQTKTIEIVSSELISTESLVGPYKTGDATLVNVTIRTNYGQAGAGIENLGTLSITNATIAWNSANGAAVGGGIYNSNGGQPLTIKNTIFTNNYSSGSLRNCSGLPNSAANGNLSSDANCGFPAGDSNVDVQLGGFDFDNHDHVIVSDANANVPQAIELRANLADFAAEHLVVVDHLVFAIGPAGGGARDREAEVALPKEGHAVLVAAAQGVHLAVTDELAGFLDLF